MGDAPLSAAAVPWKGNDDLNYERLYSYRFRDIDQPHEALGIHTDAV